MVTFKQPPAVTEAQGEDAAQLLGSEPAGRRYLLSVQLGNYIAQDGWVSYRDNPHDRTEATTLTEDITSEDRTSISVEAMPYDLGDGHELVIQTGDPSNAPLGRLPSSRSGDGRRYEGAIFAYVDGAVSQGDTTIPIDDGEGNPITITASSGDRILSNFQGLWPHHAREEIRLAVQRYMTGLTNAGGKLDGIALDTELEVHANKGIKHDPRWGDASEGIGGVSFKERLAPLTIDEVIAAGGGSSEVAKWKRTVDQRLKRHHLNDAVFEEIKKDFPGIIATDWNNSGVSEANWIPNLDGKKVFDKAPIFGSHGNYGLYATVRNLWRQQNFSGGTSLPYSYGESPIANVRWQAKFARTMYRENDGKVQPWFTFEALSDGFYFVNISGTPYYEEHLRQIALHTDPDAPLLYFNPHSTNPPATDEQDLNVNSVFEEINNQVGGESFSLHTTEEIGWQTNVVSTAVDLPNKRLWRVTVMRVDPFDDRPITVNVSNGDSFEIPGGEVGAWYESGLNEDLTFNYTHPPVDNLYPSEDFQGLGTGTWDGSPAPGLTITRNQPDPNGKNQAISIDQACCDNQMPNLKSPEVSVDFNSNYTLSFWAKGNVDFEILNQDGGRLVREDIKWGDSWVRHRVSFKTGETTSAIRLKFHQSFPEFTIARPMLNEGLNRGPYQAPSDQAPSEQAGTTQSVSLQKGGNLVSTAVQPSNLDLETVLGDATSALARVETETGQVFDPDTGTDEIGTWDPNEAYKIHAEAPTSFAVEGTALDSASVSLDEGWNWLPYLDNTRVAIDQALEPIQNKFIMVKDETGRVYRPGQGTTQIDSLKPGAAYKILLETPVTLSYPLQ